MDRKVLRMISEYYGGGPVGIESLAASLNEESDTIADTVEPYLLQIGFLKRTSRGRMISRQACEHLGLKCPAGEQTGLF